MANALHFLIGCSSWDPPSVVTYNALIRFGETAGMQQPEVQIEVITYTAAFPVCAARVE